MKKILVLMTAAASVLSGTQAVYGQNRADIQGMIDEVSRDNVVHVLERLGSFQTRHVFSSNKEGFGIMAAADWIGQAFSGAHPRLEVSFDDYVLPPQGRRLTQELTIRNVLAVLPGTKTGTDERIFIINAHYDSYARRPRDQAQSVGFDHPAPGVNDDGSGIAALIELARVLSPHEFEATIVFAALAGEEIGLVGSNLLAARLKKEEKNVCGVIGLDMIGNSEGGQGLVDNRRMRVFSDGPMDSPSRQLARYAKKIGESFFPSAVVDLIYRADRFGRGGDHTSFVLEGWAGIRMMEANENYSRQHTADDTLEHVDIDYCVRNIQLVGSILASLAAAPPAPAVTGERGRVMLGRGDGYDAALRWNPVAAEDLAGYKVHWRGTTSPFWVKEVEVGDVTEYTFRGVTIDESVFGVSAVDTEGNESLVTAYTMAPRRKTTYEIK